MLYPENFTVEQLDTLRADVLANADTLAAYINGDRAALVNLYNADAVPAVKAWDKEAPTERINDAINDTRSTPADVADSTVIYSNRAFQIFIKQMNLQTLLIRRDTINATKANTRIKIKDATTAVPAGEAGENVHPGGASGVDVLAACLRPAAVTRLEKLFSTGAQQTGTTTAEVLTLEGDINETVFIDV